MTAYRLKGCGLSFIVVWTASFTMACHGQAEAPANAKDTAVPTAAHAGTTSQQTNAERGQTAVVKVLDGGVLGTKLGPDENVAEAKDVFAPNEPIYMTLRSASATQGAPTTVQILDSNGEEVKSLFGPMGNENAVTFPLRNLPRGRYAAKGYLGDRKLCEISFEIR